ncbi:unnamed protein product, partial [marine sediment metagenome]
NVVFMPEERAEAAIYPLKIFSNSGLANRKVLFF